MPVNPDLILYEDNHLLVYNKQPGQLVQGDKTGTLPLSEELKEYLKKKYHKPGNVFMGVIHRIDRPVSGVVAFARTSKALSRMNQLIREGGMQKRYWAIVKNPPDDIRGTLHHFMVKNQAQNKSYCHPRPVAESKEAILHYKTIASGDHYHLLDIELITGRHHQIRSQLAAIGSPIRGDLKYGAPRPNPDGAVSLHARSVQFVHPVKKEEIQIVADPPREALWDYFKQKWSDQKRLRQ
jgi:23S rRNA pseudouridine1911/1915/1917 synthase